MINSLVVDEFNDKLYWVDYGDKIYHSNLDGSDVTLLNFYSDGYVEIHMIDQGYLYCSNYNREFKSRELLRRINKITGIIDQELQIKSKNNDSFMNFEMQMIVPLGHINNKTYFKMS